MSNLKVFFFDVYLAICGSGCFLMSLLMSNWLFEASSVSQKMTTGLLVLVLPILFFAALPAVVSAMTENDRTTLRRIFIKAFAIQAVIVLSGYLMLGGVILVGR
ncbi:hypothetical protein [Fibrella aestuarina]|uniref:hypothetical protein n=1 Tax=Fibrella aestuarina TaxID=651143 RepID=UPI00059C4C10|nr:hypothetical protein [Fibrella aestuarina]